MRCPRCSNEVGDDATSCGRCGLAVASSPPAADSRPAESRPADTLPTGPAPWQQASAAAGDSTPGRRPPATDASEPRAGWFPGQQEPEPEPTAPGDQYSRPFAGMVLVTLVLAAAVALAYGLLAALERRGIFAALADDPSAVAPEEANRSDTINAVVFFAGVVTTALALVLVCVWLFHVRGLVARIPLALPWGLVAIGGLGGVLAALILHRSEDAERIVTGYLVFAAGAAAVAGACLLGVLSVRRVSLEIAATRAEPDQPAAVWTAPRS